MTYFPAFRRYAPEVTAAFGRIERARGAIEAAPILPAQEEVLRLDAQVGSVHYSNVMEGNELSRLEALRAVEHGLEPDDKAKLELVNYVAALDFLTASSERGEIVYSVDFLKRLHGVLTNGLGHRDARFKPHHEGEWRDGDVAVGDALTVYHVAPPPTQVDSLMRARMEYLESKRLSPGYPTPILAGVAHFEIAEVHPFADYNGRVARLFATAVFHREQFLTRPLFSPERYYAQDKDAYYAALRDIKRTHHLDEWLEYYVTGLAVEFERIAQKVRDLADLTRTLPLPLQLSSTQERVIAMLTTEGRRFVTIPEVVDSTGMSARTASRDLNALVEAGVLRDTGATRSRRFRLASAAGTHGGRPRVWSEDAIGDRLREMAARHGRMPTYRDFKSDNVLSLYAAIQRSGGLEEWRRRLGY